MKKLSAFVSVLFLGSALSFTACKKDEEKKEEGKKTKDEGKKDDGKKDEGKKDEGKKDEGGGGGSFNTGDAACDEILKLQACIAEKTPGATQEMKDAVKTAEDGYKMGISNEASKQATIDSCKQSIDGLKQAASAVGC